MGIKEQIRRAKSVKEVDKLFAQSGTFHHISPKTERQIIRVTNQRLDELKKEDKKK